MSTGLLHIESEATGSEALTARLTCSLVEKTGNRLKDIVVRVDDERIVIQGRARTYFCLQLVLSSIRSALCEAREQVARIELITDYLKQRGTFQAVCTRSGHVCRLEARPWRLIA